MNQSEDMSKQNSFKSSKEIQNVTEKLECCSTTPTNCSGIASNNNNNNNDDHRKSNDFTNHQSLLLFDQHFSKGSGSTTPNDSCNNFHAATFCWEQGISLEDTNEQNLFIENRENAATAINGSGSNDDHSKFHHYANQQMCPYQHPHFGNYFPFTATNDSFMSVINSFNATGAQTNWQQRYIHQENPPFTMGPPISPWNPDFSHGAGPFHWDNSHRSQKRSRTNANNDVVGPQTAATLPRGVSFSNPVPVLDGNGWQARSQQSPISPDTTKAVCFGWIKHPPNKVWRSKVKLFSDDRANYPTWSDGICDQVKRLLEQEGYTTFLVCEREGNKIFDGERFRCPLRMATVQKVLEKTKQRFLDDRRKNPKSLPTSKHMGRQSRKDSQSTISTSPNSPLEDMQGDDVAHNILTFNRNPWYPITTRDVCFKWDLHPGTTRWREVVESFAANKQKYPTWTDSIARRVKKQLDSEDIHFFLVFLDFIGEPCVDIRNGLWYRATADEILERTKEQFFSDRQRLEEESSSDDDEKQPAKPNGGRPNDGSFSSWDSHGHEDSSSSSSDQDDDEGSSKPNSNVTTVAPDTMESLSEFVRQIKIESYNESAAIPVGDSNDDTTMSPANAPCPMDESKEEDEGVRPPEEQSKEIDGNIIRAGIILRALSSTTEGKAKIDTEPTENDVSLVDNGRLFNRQISDHIDRDRMVSTSLQQDEQHKLAGDDIGLVQSSGERLMASIACSFEEHHVEPFSVSLDDQGNPNGMIEDEKWNQATKTQRREGVGNAIIGPENQYDDESSSYSSLDSSNDMETESWEEVEKDELSFSDPSSPVERRIPVVPKPNDVCFQSIQHPGTIAWRDTARKFSDQGDLHPEWSDHICTLIRQELARADITDFLVLLDCKGRPIQSLTDGVWYQATDDEILKETKKAFVEGLWDWWRGNGRATNERERVGSPRTAQLNQFVAATALNINPAAGDPTRQVTTVHVTTASSLPSPERVSSQSSKLMPSPLQLSLDQALKTTMAAQSVAAQTWVATPDLSRLASLSLQSGTEEILKAKPAVPHPASLPSPGFPSKKTSLLSGQAFSNHKGEHIDYNIPVLVVQPTTPVRQGEKYCCAFIGNVAIVLDHEPSKTAGNVAVIAGEPLTGTIVLDGGDASGDHLAGRLSLRIVGKEDVFFNSTPVARRNSRDIFDHSVVIRDLSNDRLHGGVNKIPFCLPLPETLPSTAEIVLAGLAKIKVSFELQVIHKVDDQDDLILRRSISVQSRPLSGHSGPVRWGPKTHELRSMGFLKKGTLSLGVRLDNSQIGRGQTLEVSIACRNHSSVDIKRVQVKLVEQIQLFDEEFRALKPYHTESIVLGVIEDLDLPALAIRGKKKSQDIHTHGVCDAKEKTPDFRQMIEELKSALNKFALTIPEQCRDSYHGKTVVVSHFIRITLMTNFSTDNFLATIPLTVGSLPVVSRVPANSTCQERRQVQHPSARSVATNTSDDTTVVSCISALTQNTLSTPALRTVSTAPSTVISSQDGQRTQTVEPNRAARTTNLLLLNRLIGEMSNSEDSHQVISEKVDDEAWMELFASLSAEDFGRIIEHVHADVDRQSVAQLVASHIQNFTCQHAAMAIQKTSFRVSMARVLVPLCHDKSSHMSTIWNELDDWDMNFLQIGCMNFLKLVKKD